MLLDTLNATYGEFIRLVVILDMVALVGVGMFLVDYHRKETPAPIQAVLWSYIAALSFAAVAVMVNAVFGPPPTLGTYIVALTATLVVVYLSSVAIRSIKNR